MQDRRTQSGDTAMSYGLSGLNAQATPATTGAGAHGELFVRTPEGLLLAMIHTTTDPTDPLAPDAPTAGKVDWYLADHQDSIIATIDDTGDDPIRSLYEPYGHRIRTWTDPTKTDPGTHNAALTAPPADRNLYGYVSGCTDPGTTLSRVGAQPWI